MRVYLRNQPHPWSPIWLIVGTRQISVCDEFAKWFRCKFGDEADLQEVWEAMTYPGWMLWITASTYMPRCLRELMEGCVGEVGQAIGDRLDMTDATYLRQHVNQAWRRRARVMK